jgi:hypothetical protein
MAVAIVLHLRPYVQSHRSMGSGAIWMPWAQAAVASSTAAVSAANTSPSELPPLHVPQPCQAHLNYCALTDALNGLIKGGALNKLLSASPAPRASAVPSAPSAPALRARGVAMAATPEFGAVSLEPFGRIGVSLRRVWVGGVKEDGQGILQIVSPAL